MLCGALMKPSKAHHVDDTPIPLNGFVCNENQSDSPIHSKLNRKPVRNFQKNLVTNTSKFWKEPCKDLVEICHGSPHEPWESFYQYNVRMHSGISTRLLVSILEEFF